MSLKAFGLLAPLALGGLYFGGALGGRYSQDVDRPPAAVLDALTDLDIRRQPGNPGTDADRAGGVPPVFTTERTADSITWTVMSGDQVATRMTATVTPLDGGRRSRVTASVERGDAPDQLVSPAFRSESLTYVLFTSAIGDEINELTAPPAASAEHCQKVLERLTDENIASGSLDQPRSATEAVGGTLRNLGRIRRMEAVMRAEGCTDTGRRAGDPFPPVSNRMGRPPAG